MHVVEQRSNNVHPIPSTSSIPTKQTVATVAREVLAMAYNVLQNEGLILVRPDRIAAWHLTSAMASHACQEGVRHQQGSLRLKATGNTILSVVFTSSLIIHGHPWRLLF